MAKELRRGDIAIVVMAREYAKPRPGLIVQSDPYADLASVVVCPITTELRNYSHFRIPILPTPANGLEAPSQIMIDKLSALPRERISQVVGHADDSQMAAVSVALSTFLAIG